MPESTAKLTIRLPADVLASAKRYARAHRTTVTELIHRHLSSLDSLSEGDLPAEVRSVVGIIPSSMGVREEYHQQAFRKHA